VLNPGEDVVHVYTADSALANPSVLAREMVRDLAGSRDLAWRLTVRDIRARYRQAFLGVLWAFFLPLANTATWVFLSRAGIVSVGQTALPYPAYVFTGTMLWAILIDAVNAPLQQTNAARPMLAKLNFPREALVVSGIYQTLFDGGIKVALLIGALIMLGINPGWNVMLLPFGVLSLVLVGTTIGLLITPLGMLYTDVGHALPLLMQFLMYASPVVFPMPTTGWAATLFTINPLTPLILVTRAWLVGSPPVFVGYFFSINAAALGLLFVVWVTYRLAMPILIERMSA
jgi:lipopolysaccharide transport system permease protein